MGSCVTLDTQSYKAWISYVESMYDAWYSSYMSTAYSTVTSKGQITLPARWRHQLGLNPGLKVTMEVNDGIITITPPLRMEAVRLRARAQMEAAGTWGTPMIDDGWAQAVGEKLAV